MIDFLFTKTPLLFLVQNFWRDEAFTYVVSRNNIGDIIKLTAGDFNPPLYYVLIHYWMMVFGSSEFAMRMLSFTFFIATAYVAYLIMHTVWKISEKKSIIYVGLFLFNPFLLTYAFEARMYSMLAFFASLSYYAFLTKKRRLNIASCVLGLYTHYFMVFILLTQAIDYFTSQEAMMFFARIFNLNKAKHFFTDVKKSIVKDWFMITLWFLPWIMYVFYNHDFSSQDFWVTVPPFKDIIYIPFVLFTSYERVFGKYYHQEAGFTTAHMRLLIILVFIVFVGFLFWKKFKNRSHIKSLLLWSFVTPVILFSLSFVTTPYYVPRYFIASAVGFMLLLIYSIESMRIHPLQILVIFVLLSNTWSFHVLNLKYRSKRTVKTMYAEIASLTKPIDYIYLTDELDFHLAQYYFRHDAQIKLFNASYEELPQYIGKITISPENLTTTIPTYPSKAFVVYYDHFDILSQH